MHTYTHTHHTTLTSILAGWSINFLLSSVPELHILSKQTTSFHMLFTSSDQVFLRHAFCQVQAPSVVIASLWSPYGIGHAIIVLPCGFIYLSIFFFSSPNLSRRRLDVCHTSTHDVVLVWIYDAGLKRAAQVCWKYMMQKVPKKSPSGHHCTTLLGYIFATKACIDNWKKTC